MFQATAGGARPVDASDAPRYDAEEKMDEEKKEEDEEKKGEEVEDNGEEDKPKEASPEPNVSGLDISAEPAAAPNVPTPSPSPPPEVKGRVLFIYWCPPGSPVRFRMVYSTTVRGIQQDAVDKAGVEIVAKMETSDKSDLSEKHVRDEIPSRPKHSTSLPTPASGPRVFGAPAPGSKAPAFGAPAPAPARGFALPSGPAPVFGAPAPAGFGRPRPPRVQSDQTATISHSAAAAAAEDDEGDSKERIRNAFDAFGPRVSNSSGGFARPKPVGRRT